MKHETPWQVNLRARVLRRPSRSVDPSFLYYQNNVSLYTGNKHHFWRQTRYCMSILMKPYCYRRSILQVVYKKVKNFNGNILFRAGFHNTIVRSKKDISKDCHKIWLMTTIRSITSVSQYYLKSLKSKTILKSHIMPAYNTKFFFFAIWKESKRLRGGCFLFAYIFEVLDSVCYKF